MSAAALSGPPPVKFSQAKVKQSTSHRIVPGIII
jgi:hypothetical protein